ncbi:Splicing factor U2af large subunit A [Capsicum annuum]|nr:Splicing factor U2af large subunit A [Capsicum annuum]
MLPMERPAMCLPPLSDVSSESMATVAAALLMYFTFIRCFALMDSSENWRTQLTPSHTGGENEVADCSAKGGSGLDGGQDARSAVEMAVRGRRRPKKCWREVIGHDMERLQLTEDMTIDRKVWKARIRVELVQVAVHSVAMYFNHVMSAIGGNTAGPGDTVVNVNINHEKKFALVEMRSVEEASNAMTLDDIIFERTQVKVRRPTRYNPSLAATIGPSQPNPNLNLAAAGLYPGSTGGLEGRDYIFVGGLPYHFSEALIRDLLESFGPLRGFNLVKDKETGYLRGYAFCVYADVSVTDIACAALNGIKIGGKSLSVRRASQGTSQPKPEQEIALMLAQQQMTRQVRNLSILEAVLLFSPPLQVYDPPKKGGSTNSSSSIHKENSAIAPFSLVQLVLSKGNQSLMLQPGGPPTKVLCLTNVVSANELKRPEVYGRDNGRCKLVKIVIPRPRPDGEPTPGVGKVYLDFEDVETSSRAQQGLNDRKYGSKFIVVVFYPENNAYASQVGLDREEKMRFWEALDEVVRDVPSSEKIVVARDFNGHIGALSGGFGDVHGGFGFGKRNEEGSTLLDFARSFGLVEVNSSFSKKDDHLITFRSAIVKTQIDFLLLRKWDRVLCKDGEVIPSENLSTQHRLLVMDLGIRKDRKRRGKECRSRIKWDGLTPVNAWEIGEKLVGMGVWECRGDVDSMWDRVARCIRENVSKVLGISRGRARHYQGDWWWNEEVKKKVETKKGAYAKLVESKNEEKKRVNRKEYKLARKEAKLAVTTAFESLYVGLQEKGGEKICLDSLRLGRGRVVTLTR